MDAIDLLIIAELKENSRQSASQISKKIHMSVSSVSERIKKLEASGVIEKYTIKINRKKNDENLMAFILVNLDRNKKTENFKKLISAHPAVLECHHIAGSSDFILQIVLKDTDALDDFLGNSLGSITGVVSSNTIIVLKTLKEELNT